jgi:AcrR family transcriptional regulator
MTHDSEADEAEARLLRTALQLFASVGYDGTTTEMLADSAGVDSGAIVKAGGKAGLYRSVMEFTTNSLKDATREALSRVTRDRIGLHELLDCHLDFYFEHPETQFLWAQRSLSDAADLTDIEERYGIPTDELIKNAFKDSGLLEEADEHQMTTWVFSWCIRGFILEGVRRRDGVVVGQEDEQACIAFRSCMHRLLDALLPLEKE